MFENHIMLPQKTTEVSLIEPGTPEYDEAVKLFRQSNINVPIVTNPCERATPTQDIWAKNYYR